MADYAILYRRPMKRLRHVAWRCGYRFGEIVLVVTLWTKQFKFTHGEWCLK